jgi:hypothetical protein
MLDAEKKEHQKNFHFHRHCFGAEFVCFFVKLKLKRESIEHECTNLFIATQHRQKINREGTIKTPRVQLFDAVTCARQMFRLTNACMFSVCENLHEKLMVGFHNDNNNNNYSLQKTG